MRRHSAACAPLFGTAHARFQRGQGRVCACVLLQQGPRPTRACARTYTVTSRDMSPSLSASRRIQHQDIAVLPVAGRGPGCQATVAHLGRSASPIDFQRNVGMENGTVAVYVDIGIWRAAVVPKSVLPDGDPRCRSNRSRARTRNNSRLHADSPNLVERSLFMQKSCRWCRRRAHL